MNKNYSEIKATRKYFILIKSPCVVLGLFGSLTRLREFGCEQDKNFPSYSTISKKKIEALKNNENCIEIGEYSIHMTLLY